MQLVGFYNAFSNTILSMSDDPEKICCATIDAMYLWYDSNQDSHVLCTFLKKEASCLSTNKLEGILKAIIEWQTLRQPSHSLLESVINILLLRLPDSRLEDQRWIVNSFKFLGYSYSPFVLHNLFLIGQRYFFNVPEIFVNHYIEAIKKQVNCARNVMPGFSIFAQTHIEKITRRTEDESNLPMYVINYLKTLIEILKEDKMKNAHDTKKNISPWKSGLFYLLVFVAVSVIFVIEIKLLEWWSLPFLFIGAFLAVSIIGAFQLKQDEKLSEKNFLNLMVEVFKRLPLLRAANKGPTQKGSKN